MDGFISKHNTIIMSRNFFFTHFSSLIYSLSFSRAFDVNTPTLSRGYEYTKGQSTFQFYIERQNWMFFFLWFTILFVLILIHQVCSMLITFPMNSSENKNRFNNTKIKLLDAKQMFINIFYFVLYLFLPISNE